MIPCENGNNNLPNENGNNNLPNENRNNNLQQENVLIKTLESLIELLEQMGVNKSLTESIRTYVMNCLSSVQPNNKYPINKIVHEKAKNVEKITPEIKNYCKKFRNKMSGIENINGMINKVKELIESGKLKIINDKMGKHINLDGLGYEIYLLDLNNYNNTNYKKVYIKKRQNSTDFSGDKYETNLEGLKDISNNYLIVTELKVPDEKDIKEILSKLKILFPEIIFNTERSGIYHDEDIAFFMLITQSYGEFFIKNNNVLKCYDNYRGVRKLPENQDRTAQVRLVGKKLFSE